MNFKTLNRKFITALITFFMVISASFFLLRILPGSPFDEGRFLSADILEKMEKKYGLDKPLTQQYSAYIGKLIRGDLGPSLKYPNRDVQDILWDAAPVSFELGIWAMLLALIFGITLGSTAALFPNKFIGKFALIFSSISISMPSFVFAGILITIFGLQLNWLPVALWEGPEYKILPILTLAIAPTAYITRISRSSLMDTLGKEHIKTALAKGLGYWTVVMKHAIYNSLIPIVTFAGPLLAVLITGSFVVEYVYALPGMGKYFVTAFINRDYFLVSGVVVIFSIVLLVVNTVVDLIVIQLDPKQRSL